MSEKIRFTPSSNINRVCFTNSTNKNLVQVFNKSLVTPVEKKYHTIDACERTLRTESFSTPWLLQALFNLHLPAEVCDATMLKGVQRWYQKNISNYPRLFIAGKMLVLQ